MQDFTTVKRPDINKLKLSYDHTKDKRFYMPTSGEYPMLHDDYSIGSIIPVYLVYYFS